MTDLRKLAEAATPGPWKLFLERPWAPKYVGVHSQNGLQTIAKFMDSSCPWSVRDAAYIAAANPQAILERKELQQAEKKATGYLADACLLKSVFDRNFDDREKAEATIAAVKKAMKSLRITAKRMREVGVIGRDEPASRHGDDGDRIQHYVDELDKALETK